MPVFLPEESPWIDEPGRLQSMDSPWSQKEMDMTEQLSTAQRITKTYLSKIIFHVNSTAQ